MTTQFERGSALTEGGSWWCVLAVASSQGKGGGERQVGSPWCAHAVFPSQAPVPTEGTVLVCTCLDLCPHRLLVGLHTCTPHTPQRLMSLCSTYAGQSRCSSHPIAVAFRDEGRQAGRQARPPQACMTPPCCLSCILPSVLAGHVCPKDSPL
jgi:hypothetical protein